ncbi:MAG: molybdopterin molybdotransferase MoeA [Actinomycetes bacterium]
MPDTTVADARTLLRSWCGAPAVEEVARDAALGRVAAGEVRAGEDVRPEATAAMDGVAVRAADTPGRLRRSGEARAGGAHTTTTLAPGTAVPISTGAVLPPGADAVVRREHVTGDGAAVTVGAVAPGRDVRPAGTDLARGTPVLAPGEVVGPAHLGVLATLGVGRVSVHRRPRVALVVSGDEVVDPTTTPGPGQVRDANAAWLAARLAELGADVAAPSRASDDPAALATVLADAAAGADLVVVTGGASVGPHDHTATVLGTVGEGRSLSLPLRPGRPCVVGRVGTVPVLGLPGTPLAAFVVFELVGAPTVRAAAGRRDTVPPVLPLRVATATEARDDGRTSVVPVRLVDGTVVPTGWRGSSQLIGAAGADGLALLTHDVEAGAVVPVLLLTA